MVSRLGNTCTIIDRPQRNKATQLNDRFVTSIVHTNATVDSKQL